ncbi:hypothetical protein VTI28DRAFT_9850 [Corynascus sepedonium]
MRMNPDMKFRIRGSIFILSESLSLSWQVNHREAASAAACRGTDLPLPAVVVSVVARVDQELTVPLFTPPKRTRGLPAAAIARVKRPLPDCCSCCHHKDHSDCSATSAG